MPPVVPVLFVLVACAPAARVAPPARGETGEAPAEATRGDVVLRGARLPGGADPVDVVVADGRIVAVGPGAGGDVSAPVEDVTGRWLAPAFIDSHVHLAYLPRAADLAAGGVAAAVDLAAPFESIGGDTAPVQVLWSGPMVTAAGGYPTQGWGRYGYGLEVTGADEAAAAVGRLVEAGAGVVKVPQTGGPSLPPDAFAAAVQAAHTRGLRVASHALGDAEAAIAAAAGADVLAHTPTEALGDAGVAAWAERAVVTSLVAFGNADVTRTNLARLKAAGATVLYGTDFGNLRTAGIVEQELRAMVDAGLTAAEVLAAGTATPAAYWGFDDLGALEEGKRASLLVVDADPLGDPLTLSRPLQVWIDGGRVR